MTFKTIEELVGNTPLIEIPAFNKKNTIYAKLEGNNPGGSVKDRPAMRMIIDAEKKGIIKKGDTLIEATSGNTGIALSMAAAIKGYKMIIIMPETASDERIKTMKVYGSEVILVDKEKDMEGARDLANKMRDNNEGIVLDQFANPSNYLAHFDTTGPEIWNQTKGKVTHFVSAMGTTGTITGVSQFLKTKNKDIKIIGVQPKDKSRIPGIRRWKKGYLPAIFEHALVDEIIDVSQEDAERSTKELTKESGLFCGISSGANIFISHQISKNLENAYIVTILCDRGDRYLSKI
ncbi:MAG: cysteine synthase CysM [Pseudomonadota bacterium]|nr:cysteine synthase CysM [Pseudomonadota bacterium]MED5274812.1 cysteine synthase CysM [Pseudomonadota bacterium]MED5430050.1 cysteine synthase CysM [Pseudomonadota bacterium]|tara:strand:- start:5915 stop:6787 length:873 start_codon:yes stop_codon:yes gene_type:complete